MHICVLFQNDESCLSDDYRNVIGRIDLLHREFISLITKRDYCTRSFVACLS